MLWANIDLLMPGKAGYFDEFPQTHASHSSPMLLYCRFGDFHRKFPENISKILRQITGARSLSSSKTNGPTPRPPACPRVAQR
jgi:hypothetical protein